MKYKINLHSMTDLITNSSTTIFTLHDNSVKPCKELVNEVLALMGSDKKCDDIFELSVEADLEYATDMVYDRLQDLLDEEEYKALKISDDYSKGYDKVQKILKDIRSGKMEKPDWYDELIEDNEDMQGNTELVIVVKDPQFQKLAEKVIKFLNSVDTQESYD
jgi:hypothetical protein